MYFDFPFQKTLYLILLLTLFQNYFMNIQSLLVFISFLFLFSCQTSKQTEDTEKDISERVVQIQQKHKQDSIQRAFCECLIDSTNNEEILKNIDNFLAQNIDINNPCNFPEEVVSGVAEAMLINMGVSISNRILRTRFKKRSAKVNTVPKNYPILMLFNEDTAMIRQLVSRGADLNAKTKDIISLTNYYVSKNELENVKFVLSLGAKAEEINIVTNDEKMIDFLIENGAKKENIDKIILLENDNYKKLAEKYKINLSKTTCEEFNTISKVTQFQKINFERTKWLLENGVEASCIDGDFLEAIISENFDGRFFNSRTKKKPNQHTRKEWIELVGKYNINWNQCASFGKSPLMLAVEKHDKELIQSLLNQNADANFACGFAGQNKTAKDTIEKEIQYAEKNEEGKREREKEKYNTKSKKKYTTYINKLNEIKKLLKQK